MKPFWRPFCALFGKTNAAVSAWQERGQESAAAAAAAAVAYTDAVCFGPGAVDLPLFDCFVLVHIDGGDGMLGARLHLPVHLPLGVFRLGLEQVHPLLCFDPAGNGEGRRGKKRRKGRVNFIRGDDLCARSGVSALCVQQSSSLVLRHGKSNSTDESITEMNEDGSAVIHEARSEDDFRSQCSLTLSTRL